jgi:hypothetical protein
MPLSRDVAQGADLAAPTRRGHAGSAGVAALGNGATEVFKGAPGLLDEGACL